MRTFWCVCFKIKHDLFTFSRKSWWCEFKMSSLFVFKLGIKDNWNFHFPISKYYYVSYLSNLVSYTNIIYTFGNFFNVLNSFQIGYLLYTYFYLNGMILFLYGVRCTGCSLKMCITKKIAKNFEIRKLLQDVYKVLKFYTVEFKK